MGAPTTKRRMTKGLCLALLMASMVATIGLSADPASAHTRDQAVDIACGTDYTIKKVVPIVSAQGRRLGEVILAGTNPWTYCVVTNKTATHGSTPHGVRGRMDACIQVSGGDEHCDPGDWAHWASPTERVRTSNCKFFRGYIKVSWNEWGDASGTWHC